MAPTLLSALSELYLDVASIQRVLADATIDPAPIPFTGSALNIWAAVLTEARKQRKLRLLLNVAQSDYPAYTPLREAIENLIHMRPDGYVVYGSESGNGGIREDLREIRNDIDKLRDHVLHYDEINRKEISDERHKVKDLQNALALYQAGTKMQFERLTETMDAQQKRIDSMSNAGRWMLWFGVVTGVAAVVAQIVSMLVMRAFGW